MIEEPYRWVEAVANRREYVETQLAAGSPIAAVGYRDGIVLVTLGRTRQKLFEIYDRIAMGAIGHPGDIERLRMAVIELASTEGFTRSAADVSLRRLAYYSLSPVLKTAFEQVYGAPYLARMLFAEVGDRPENDLFLRVEYDGAIATSGGAFGDTRQHFGVLSGTRASTELMETFLNHQRTGSQLASLDEALLAGVNAWVVGNRALAEDTARELPTADVLNNERQKHLAELRIEAAILERTGSTAIRYRTVTEEELRSVGGK